MKWSIFLIMIASLHFSCVLLIVPQTHLKVTLDERVCCRISKYKCKRHLRSLPIWVYFDVFILRQDSPCFRKFWTRPRRGTGLWRRSTWRPWRRRPSSRCSRTWTRGRRARSSSTVRRRGSQASWRRYAVHRKCRGFRSRLSKGYRLC